MSTLQDKIPPNWRLTTILVSISVLLFAWIIINFGFNEESIRMNIRWSARLSLVCFCLAFMSSSMYALLQNIFSSFILKNRKYFGVAFAVIHGIHLGFLLTLHQYFYQVFTYRPLTDILLGGLAYLFILIMVLTSFSQVESKMPRRLWKSIHLIGGYWILIVFSNSILGRVFRGQLDYIPLGILVMSVWIMRILAWNKRRI